MSAAAKDSVEGICSKIYHISLEYVKRIREKHLAILKENNISGREHWLACFLLCPSPSGTEPQGQKLLCGHSLLLVVPGAGRAMLRFCTGGLTQWCPAVLISPQ